MLVEQEPQLPPASTLRESLVQRGGLHDLVDERARWRIEARLTEFLHRFGLDEAKAPEVNLDATVVLSDWKVDATATSAALSSFSPAEPLISRSSPTTQANGPSNPQSQNIGQGRGSLVPGGVKHQPPTRLLLAVSVAGAVISRPAANRTWRVLHERIASSSF